MGVSAATAENAKRVPRSLVACVQQVGATTDYDAYTASYKNLRTQPRPQLGDVTQLVNARRPFLCPHPGCGKSYAAEGTLRFHFKHTHENRQRLAMTMPVTDYAMGAYWPKDNPWRPDGPLAPYIPIEVTDGCLYQCKHCGQRFMKGFHLRNHYMTIHKTNTCVLRSSALAALQPVVRLLTLVVPQVRGEHSSHHRGRRPARHPVGWRSYPLPTRARARGSGASLLS